MRLIYALIFMALLFSTITLQAQDVVQDSISFQDLLTMNLDDLLNVRASIASKTEQSIEEAPSVVSVITHAEIKAMGARELADVLQLVPGFETHKNVSVTNLTGVRGLKDPRFACKILLLLDGRPINDVFYSSYSAYSYLFDMENIERIEIIRGPGSAMYGRNAFSGVINIISKTGNEESGISVECGSGNYNTSIQRVAIGNKNKKINFHVAGSYIRTDGSDAIDPNTNQRWTSEANNGTINASVEYKDFSFNARYLSANVGNWQNGMELYKSAADYMLAYKNALSDKVKVRAQIYGLNSRHIEDIQLQEPGEVSPLGLYVTPSFNEYLYGAQFEMGVHFSEKHNSSIGMQAEAFGVTNAIIKSNFLPVDEMSVYEGRGHYNQILFEDGWVVNDGKDYTNWALYGQHIWKPINRLALTLGARLDHESEIGLVFNPRFGLVWDVFPKATFKMMYGSAYRSPNASQQYQTQGFAMGNPDLRPEKIKTFESAFIYSWPKMTTQVNVFHNFVEDMIYASMYITPDVSQTPANRNMGKNVATGIEFENKVFFGERIYSFLNYAYTVSKNTDTFGDDSEITYDHVDVAPHKFNAGVNVAFMKNFNLNSTLMYRSKMKKFFNLDEQGNHVDVSTDPIGNYAIVNATFRYIGTGLLKGFDTGVSVYNLFNTKYYAQEAFVAQAPEQGRRQIIFRASYLIPAFKK
ncbi:TonB-dependent receptor plug domain-containing protein [Labilibacter marinus]|uniref:TonB-dependent receptor plug domain-containing protein n=1 Tax=Labilibacter marinus TaxID=1477105 RepID=UPI00094FA0A1|nr:TonB-dependent receptor [Labilibacter marinus]